MNRIILIVVGALFLLQIWLLIKVYKADDRIAYIDTGKLLQSSEQMKGLKKQLEADRQKAKSNVDTLTLEFENALKDYEKNFSKMTAKEKELSKQLLNSKQNQLMQYQQAIEQKVTSEEQNKTQELLTSINVHISEYGAKNNYMLIFATSSGNIAYGDKGVDITEEIIKGINEK